MKRFYKNNINSFYLIISLLLVSVLGFFYYNFQKAKFSSNMVDHTQLVLRKSNDILLDIITIESGARGFVLTGNRSFLIPFKSASKTIGSKLTALKILTNDSPSQQIRIDSMIKTAEKRGAVIQEVILAKGNSTLMEPKITLFINESINFTALIRTRIKAFNEEEFYLLKRRKIETEENIKNTGLLFLLLIFLLVGTFAFVAYTIKTQRNKILLDEKLKKVDNLFQEMIYSSSSMIALLTGPDMIIKITNHAIMNSWGKGTDIIGKSLFTLLPEILEQGFEEILTKVYQTGEMYSSYETPVNIFRNGQNEKVYYSFIYQPHSNLEGQIDGIVIIANEVTSQALINIKIQESEEYFRLIAELMPEKVTNATPDGKVFYYNKSWQDFTGESLDNLVSKGWGRWIHEDEVEETTQRWLKSVATGDDFNMELRMKNHFGNYRWHTSKARAVKDENGDVKLWIGYNNDIHDQKTQNENLEYAIDLRTRELENVNESLVQKVIEIEETRAKLLSEYSRSLIEASHDPLFTISLGGRITDVNTASAFVTGVSRADLIGSDFITYFTNPEKAKVGYEQVFKKGFVVDFPLTIKDHKLTDVLFNGSVYKDEKGEVVGAVVVARDITLQKTTEHELNEAKVFAEMATEIAQVAKEKAEIATEIAQNAVKAKQQFLSNMSHEIRTPMNAIIGFTKVVLKTNLTAKQKEYMSAIKISGDALIVLINDILDLAKVEAGKMTFEHAPFKLHLSIEAMVNLFEPRIQEKNLILIKKYDKNIPEILIGDSIRLHQIIMNLMSNALKFTSKGKILIAVTLKDESDEAVNIEFTVSDTGIGIAEDKLEGIFEKFNQATVSTSRMYGGTGLGLAIVKQLVESQGGSIAIKSKIGEGSTFSFELAFQKTKDQVVLEPEIIELDREVKDVKVLVVEDMPLNQLLMKTLLDDFGFESDITFNGKLAIEKLELLGEQDSKIKPYDLILMDLQMPEMNGYQATAYIRNTLKSDIPIIALTADVTTADVEKCRAIGMNDYISKPVNERLLYSKILALVKKPVIILTSEKKTGKHKKQKAVDLSYLLQRTKSNPKLMIEMISVYLVQTPPLLFAMKQSLKDKDWKLLEQAVHKMLPSFSIMGMSTDFENMARKIQEYASTQQMTESIQELVHQLDDACTQACAELELELKRFKNIGE